MTSTAMERAQNIQTEISGAGSLVVQGPIGSDDWRTLAQIANVIGGTEFVPKGLRGNKPAIMACLLYGRDQGVPSMIALSEIHMVDGRPTMSAHLMAAKARANGHRISRAETRDESGNVVAVTAKGVARDGTEDEVTWTLKDAERAGLLAKTNWQKYPRQMLWARAVSELCNTLFTDAFLGSVYTVEEVEETLEQHDGLDAEFSEVAATDAVAPADVGGNVSRSTLPHPQGQHEPGAGITGGDVHGQQAAADAAPAVATGQVRFESGRHAGKTVAEVAELDPEFLWGAVTYKQGPVGDAIRDWLDEHPETAKSNPPAGEQTELV